MEKIKNFWNEHKVQICVIGGVIVVGTVIYLVTKNSKYKLDTKGKKVIWWKDIDNGFMDIERVKDILDANNDNSSAFAIFREGPNPAEYSVIMLSDDVII